jgi:hypothetical protein
MMPWQEVHCDSIGPWKIELRARSLTFHAMTMMDLCTNLVEIRSIVTTTAWQLKTHGQLIILSRRRSFPIKVWILAVSSCNVQS